MSDPRVELQGIGAYRIEKGPLADSLLGHRYVWYIMLIAGVGAIAYLILSQPEGGQTAGIREVDLLATL